MFEKIIVLFNGNASNRPKVTVKIFIHTRILKNVTISTRILCSTANQHIFMISEGSCDTEDCSNDAENSALIA